MIVLAIHPLVQAGAIVLAFYAAYLGYKRTRTLHFGAPAAFDKDRHVLAGSLALIVLLAGMAGGAIMVARYLAKPVMESLHGKGAMLALPFLLFGIISGFYMYFYPKKRTVFPALHGLNNLVFLILTVVQFSTGITLYLNLTD